MTPAAPPGPGRQPGIPHNEAEFTRSAPWTADSRLGFIVRIESRSGVSYADAEGCIFVDAVGRVFLESESLEHGLQLHLNSPRNEGFEQLSRDRTREVLQRVAHALRFLGYRTEIAGKLR
jgi:hypothetical protein